jgi:hypothetical protein
MELVMQLEIEWLFNEIQTKFNENPSVGSKVITGHTKRGKYHKPIFLYKMREVGYKYNVLRRYFR